METYNLRVALAGITGGKPLKNKQSAKKAKKRETPETRETPDWKDARRLHRRSISPCAVGVVTVHAPLISNHPH